VDNAILGALIGVGGIIIGFMLTSVWDSRREMQRSVAARRELARALLAEVEALLERYTEVVATPIQQWQQGQPLELGGYVRSANFFAVYDGNTGKLGSFVDQDAATIVRAYTLAKAHLQSINLVVETMREYHRQIVPYRVIQNPIGSGLEADLQAYLNVACPRLRTESQALVTATDAAKTALRRYAEG